MICSIINGLTYPINKCDFSTLFKYSFGEASAFGFLRDLRTTLDWAANNNKRSVMMVYAFVVSLCGLLCGLTCMQDALESRKGRSEKGYLEGIRRIFHLSNRSNAGVSIGVYFSISNLNIVHIF